MSRDSASTPHGMGHAGHPISSQSPIPVMGVILLEGDAVVLSDVDGECDPHSHSQICLGEIVAPISNRGQKFQNWGPK